MAEQREKRTVYYVGWARAVGCPYWRKVCYVYVNDQEDGWNWIYSHMTQEQIDAESLCVLPCGEHPYRDVKDE